MVAQRAFSRFDIYLTMLDPTVGSEIRKSRPCLIVSPNELNHFIKTVIIAPLTSGEQTYPSRVPCTFQGTSGQIALDQIRTVDKTRLTRRLGTLDSRTSAAVLVALNEMFAP